MSDVNVAESTALSTLSTKTEDVVASAATNGIEVATNGIQATEHAGSAPIAANGQKAVETAATSVTALEKNTTSSDLEAGHGKAAAHGGGHSGSLRAIFFALAANLAIAIAKLVAALVTGSSSMLAEAIHSFADCANQLLLLFGKWQAKKKPDQDHPLGYGKASFFWSFIVAILLFSMGGIFSIYEGVQRLQHHEEELTSPWIAIGILLFSMAAEGLSLFGAVREVNQVRGNKPFWKWFMESRESELIVVVGEDTAALFGLSCALIFVALTMVTGDSKYDSIGSIVIGCLLVLIACVIGYRIYGLLLGVSASPEIRAAINDHLTKSEEVEKLLNVITLQLGDDVMVAVKARMKEGATSAAQIAENINKTERQLKAEFPAVKWVFFEPDLRDD